MDSHKRCIICKDVGKLTILGRKGLATILSCSRERGDGLIGCVNVNGLYGIHENCRRRYTKLLDIGMLFNADVKVKPCELNDLNAAQALSNFSWECDCFLCGKKLKMKDKEGKMKKVCSLSKTSKNGRSQDRVLAVCRQRSDPLAVEVSNRVTSIDKDLTTVNARYHVGCMHQFMDKSKQCAVDIDKVFVGDVNIDDSLCGALNQTSSLSMGLPNVSSVLNELNVNCGVGAMSHHDYLLKFAVFNSLELLETAGGGDCFFDSVRQCIVKFGLIRSVRELRMAAGLELEMNAELYRYVYLAENEVGQNEQSATYGEFVRKTSHGQEWATQVTVAAMARSLDMVIQLISTDTDRVRNCASGFVESYRVGVKRLDRSIVIGFNKMSAHYVGFVPEQRVLDVVVNMECDPVIELNVLEPILIDSNCCIDVSVNDEVMSCEIMEDVFTGMLIDDLPANSNSLSVEVLSDVRDSSSFETIAHEVPHVVTGDMEVDEEMPEIGVSIEGLPSHCMNCLRVETSLIPINLKLLHCDKITLRRIRLLSKCDSKNDVMLCRDCRVYLEVEDKLISKKLWMNGWPTVIAYLLTHPKHSSIRGEVWKLLPSIHRESWSSLVASAQFDMSQCCEFTDFGASSLRYNAQVKSGSIADFVKANDEACFPCVKCPAGCAAFTDECDCLEVHHYLAWKFGLSIFDSNRELLNGARTDWPRSLLELDVFSVTPGMIVNERGLCILLCKSHGGSLKKAIIHIPRHPILGNMGAQLPDLDAAAILTPNVVRAGRMGKWTNSSHVINAVGGYSGISSSSIAQRLDSDYYRPDERLGAASFLAINYREDVRRTVHLRYLQMPDGRDLFERDLEYYDNYLKPEHTLTLDCLTGGTFVFASDAFKMHDSFFNRDSLAGASSDKAHRNSLSLLFVPVHPPTAHGRNPYDTSSIPSTGDNVVLNTCVRLLIHSSSVHCILLNEFDRSGSVYLGKLLGFVKKLSLQSDSFRPFKSFRSSKEALEGTVEEMNRLQVSDGQTHCETVADLLCALSPDHISSYVVPSSSSVSDIEFDRESDIVIMFRVDSRVSRVVVPTQLMTHKLVAAFGEDGMLRQFFFRWHCNLKFWKVTYQAHSQSSEMVEAGGAEESALCFHQWQLLVFVKSCRTDLIDHTLMTSLGVQEKMRCGLHDQYLVKKSMMCKAMCCVNNCDRNARWLCLAKGLPCIHGVCLSHGRDFLRSDVVVDVFQNVSGRRLPSRTPVSEPMTTAAESSGDDESREDSDLDVFAPIGQEDPCDSRDLPSLHSRKDMIPIYDVNRQIPGHYLWSKGYGVMRRNNMHSNVEANAMMQHIVSVTNSPCVSLLYPEGQLFPRTFWNAQGNAIVGSIPSFMLNCFANSAHHGIASLNEHHAIRIKDCSLLTSKQNSYWHYMFDLALNQQLNRCSSKLVFKRGLEFLLEDDKKPNHGTQSRFSESSLPMDEAESTRRIKELASLLKKKKWTYFITVTLNMSETPGVRRITRAIRNMAAGDAGMERELTDAYLPVVLRVWERFVRILFQELFMRNDNIIGKVVHFFGRFEFQDAGSLGNAPHYHAGVTLEDEPIETSLDRICCNSAEFATSEFGSDFTSLRDLGLVSDDIDYRLWCEIYSIVQTHDCDRAGGRCKKKTNADGDKVCRYRRQPQMPLEAIGKGWFETIDVPYSEEVYILLEEMGLAGKEYDANTGKFKWVLFDELVAGKWHYRARTDEFFIASIPLLSAITRSACNVDQCDRKFQVSYLLKYVSGIEERRGVDLIGGKQIDDARVTTEEHAHLKITNCKKIADLKALTRQQSGREVSLAEVVWFVLGFRYTHCTANFIHVPTLPLGLRAAVKKFTSTSCEQSTAPEKRVSAGLVAWRRFTVGQEAHLDEYYKSSVLLDVTSAFNLRPPELLIFDNLQLYHECFVAVRVKGSSISCNLAEAAWLDGLGRQVKVNSCSLDKVLQFLNEHASNGNEIAVQLLDEVFVPLKLGNFDLEKIFVQYVDAREMVSVISFVRPWHRPNFLTHLCLSLGRYETEMDVFCSGSIVEAFVRVGLLTSSSTVTRADVLSILKKYITQDLAFHPISARQFSRYCQAAMDTLCDVFLNGSFGNYTPCMSEVMLKEQATEQLATFEEVRRSNLITGLFDDLALADSLPANLHEATVDRPLQWIPFIIGTVEMSPESVREQSEALRLCVRAVDTFMDPACRGVKFPLLVGRPGSGKSFVLKLVSAYVLSRGLKLELMSYTSERARKLGGNHLHAVFPLPVSRAPVTVSNSVVNACLAALEKDPLKKAVIRRTDVFVFEEIGLLSSQTFSALDSILQYIMGNTLPWGGKLLISCGDSKQLPPVSGQPIWSSVVMCTTMDVIVFKSDVRAKDLNLRWLNDQCRRDLNPVESAALADRIVTLCRVVADWSLVPDNAVRIVSTRSAEQDVMEQFLSSKVTRSFNALDEVQNNMSWVLAENQVTKRLDKALYEYGVCRLFVNAVVRLTYNERHRPIQFSQGQLAVVTCLPDESLPFSEQKLTLRLAPPGIRSIDVENIPPVWPEVHVGRRTTHPLVVGRCLQMGRRTQFPVRYHLTSTIHRIQGETVPLYATQISEVDRQYRLWQKEQLTVLISRAQQCADIIFVGSIVNTRGAILNILARTSKWDLLVDNYLSSLDVLTRLPVREVRLALHPFTPLYRELPLAVCGYVYLLASIANSRVCFVGETDDLKKCLRQHNTGYGTVQTRPTELHPWGVFAFICGFERNDPVVGRTARQEFFETLVFNCSLGPESVYVCMRDAVTEHIAMGEQLVIVKCGELNV